MIETPKALKPIIQFLQHYLPYKQMSSAHLEYLAMHLEQVFFAENETIISAHEGVVDNFYIIKTGQVSAEKIITEQSQSAMSAATSMEILNPGQCFPISALVQKRAVYFKHLATKNSICYTLKQHDFEYLMQQSDFFNHFISSNS